MTSLNYHHLYYFYVIAEKGTVSGAAKALRVSQPALSFQLKSLQDQLGVKLFLREGNRLVLTEDGQFALAYARQIFDAGREFVDHLHDRSLKGRTRVQIGIANAVPKIFANALLRFILKQDPAASLHVVEDTVERMAASLDEHRLDFLLADKPFAHGTREDIGNHLAGRVPVLFFCHKKDAARYRDMPSCLQGAPVVLPTADSRIHHAVQEYFLENRIQPKIVGEIQDIELVRLMVRERMGIAPLPGFQGENPVFFENLVPLREDKPSIHQTLYVIVKKRRSPHPFTERILAGFRIGPS
jgi:LysR family transcriptional regulator, transcriptional activator of nhaA